MGRLKTAAKMLARSRSLRFVNHHFAQPTAGAALASVSWSGGAFHYRPGTSDTALAYNILMKAGRKSEYCPPREFGVPAGSVRTILDIGANIGASAVYLSRLYPEATVHAFEPAPANVAVLRRNAAAYGRIEVHPFALGDADGELELFDSDDPANFGGFSAHGAGINAAKSTRVPVRRTDRALAELGITTVDIIKVDTEGAEWEILTAMDPAMLAGAKLIMGELHGRRDFALLDFLQPQFAIGMRKNIRNRLFNFYAVQRSHVA